MPRGSQKIAEEGCCRLCGAAHSLTRHHLVPQAWFRRKHVQHVHAHLNIIPLCRYCHQSVEGERGLERSVREVRRLTARHRLRAHLTADELEFVIAVRGKPWLNHHYPLEVRRHLAVAS